MGDSVININKMAINYLPKWKNQRKVSFLNETLPNVNIPILPINILDFCKQKLAAPPLGPMSHLRVMLIHYKMTELGKCAFSQCSMMPLEVHYTMAMQVYCAMLKTWSFIMSLHQNMGQSYLWNLTENPKLINHMGGGALCRFLRTDFFCTNLDSSMQKLSSLDTLYLRKPGRAIFLWSFLWNFIGSITISWESS